MTDWVLYCSTRSPFARKVRMALREAGQDGRVAEKFVVTSPMRPSPDLAGVNTLGMIPSLVLQDGEILFDSAAILDALDQMPGGGFLFPASGAERREVMRRQAFADGMMDKAVKWMDERFREQNKDTVEHIDGYRGTVAATLDWFEGRALPARTKPDAGDLALFCALAYLDFRFADFPWRDGRPKLARWFDAFTTRPSAAETAFSAG